MNAKTILKEQIKNYLLENSIDRSQVNPYSEAARHFNVDVEVIRMVWRKLRRNGLVETDVTTTNFIQIVGTKTPPSTLTTSSNGTGNPTYHYINNGDTATLKKNVEKEVKTLEDLVEACDIDTDEWTVEKWECKKWDLGIKNSLDEIETKQLYSVAAQLKRRVVDKDINKQKDILLEQIKDYVSENRKPQLYEEGVVTDECLLELSMPDVHFGKMSWREESGEDYDLKIACQRYKNAVADLVAKTPRQMIDRILLPIGNDMITIDSRKNMTTAGTPQDSDSRFRKMLLTVRNLLIEVIDGLAEIAPVDVVVISGNHDYDSMFTIGMVLEAFYHNHSRVSIDNAPTQRKYYQYGVTGLMFTHGNEEKHGDLGLIFATENTQMWAATKFREVQLGHYHKSKKVQYVSVDEFQGFQIQILPSLSGTDFWHNSKGYMSLKQAKAFLFDKSEGKIAEFTHSVKC